MAIDESDREDLLRDAKMMPTRGEAQIDGHTIVVGFRSDGQLSLYCDADPVFQFNANKQLRRVYFQGQRYSADRGKLIKLVKENQGGKVTFRRDPASDEESDQIRLSLEQWILSVKQVPDDAWTSAEDDEKFTSQLQYWLHNEPAITLIADAPNA